MRLEVNEAENDEFSALFTYYGCGLIQEMSFCIALDDIVRFFEQVIKH